MDIYVQSFLNSATTGTFSVSTTTTVSQLKQSIWTATGVTTTIMQLHYDNVELANTATLGVYYITTGSLILSSNNISDSTLWTKDQRQVLKLELAQLRRQAGGNTTTNYYRIYNVYDVDLLADKYTSNTTTVGTTSTLAVHRPWTT